MVVCDFGFVELNIFFSFHSYAFAFGVAILILYSTSTITFYMRWQYYPYPTLALASPPDVGLISLRGWHAVARPKYLEMV